MSNIDSTGFTITNCEVSDSGSKCSERLPFVGSQASVLKGMASLSKTLIHFYVDDGRNQKHNRSSNSCLV